MAKNVLVFPCGSEIGLEIHRSVRYSIHFNLFGASSADDHGGFAYERYIGGVPYVYDPDFLDALNRVIDEHRIDFIMPAHDSVLLKVAQEKARGALHCEVVTSPVATCEIARSKRATYQALSGIVPVPAVYDVPGPGDFPVFLKPDVGQGSKGTYKAERPEEVEFHRIKDPSLLILEYLPGREYTVDCFTDRHGRLLFCQGRERGRIAGGISVRASRVADERVEQLGKAINGALDFRGAWFFQVKENWTGDLVLLEVAPRIAGTMALARCLGVNLPLLSLFDANDVDVEIFANDHDLVLDRALGNRFRHNIDYRHVYLDFDDLVCADEKLNPMVMAFIFQCLNKKVSVHLITRHQAELETTLGRYRLGALFDEVIWIRNGEGKELHIKERDAIFIDDSYAERKRVHEACGIPVFDAHMIEALLETV
jgi:hypothetical protein